MTQNPSLSPIASSDPDIAIDRASLWDKNTTNGHDLAVLYNELKQSTIARRRHDLSRLRQAHLKSAKRIGSASWPLKVRDLGQARYLAALLPPDRPSGSSHGTAPRPAALRHRYSGTASSPCRLPASSPDNTRFSNFMPAISCRVTSRSRSTYHSSAVGKCRRPAWLPATYKRF